MLLPFSAWSSACASDCSSSADCPEGQGCRINVCVERDENPGGGGGGGNRSDSGIVTIPGDGGTPIQPDANVVHGDAQVVAPDAAPDAGGPDLGISYEIGPATFDPNAVYLLGHTEIVADHEITMNVITREELSVGFNGVLGLDAITIRPSDGRLLYVRINDWTVRVFEPESLGPPLYPNGPPSYPANAHLNDPILPTPNCPSVNNFRLRPNNTYVYSCTDSRIDDVYDESGAVVFTWPDTIDLIAIADDNTALFEHTRLSVRTSTGTVIRLDALPGVFIRHTQRLAADGRSFLVVMSPQNYPFEPELWRIEFDGTYSLVGDYGVRAEDRTGVYSGRLDANLDLYTIEFTDIISEDVIVRRRLNGTPEIIYTDVNDPLVKIHISYLFSGP
jgi:hypothetical protein